MQGHLSKHFDVLGRTWIWDLKTNVNYLLIISGSCLNLFTSEPTVYSLITTKMNIRWWHFFPKEWMTGMWPQALILTVNRTSPPQVIVCCLWLTSEPLANRKFLVITHLKNLTELNARAYLSLTELEVWLQGRLWWKGDEWALFSLQRLLGWNMYGNEVIFSSSPFSLTSSYLPDLALPLSLPRAERWSCR